MVLLHIYTYTVKKNVVWSSHAQSICGYHTLHFTCGVWISHYPILHWSHITQCVCLTYMYGVPDTHCWVWIFTTMTSYCAIAFFEDSWELFVRVEAEAVFLLVLGHLAQRLLRRKLPERKLYVSGKFWAILKSHVLSLCIASYSTLAYDSFVIHSSCVRECSLTFLNSWVILHFKKQPATLIRPSWNLWKSKV